MWNTFLKSLPDYSRNVITVKKIIEGCNIFFVAEEYKKKWGPFNDSQQIIEQDLYRCCAEILLSQGILHFHCSFVLYQNKAIIFTGPSGIGKTTQAELWRDNQNALIVNGDASLLGKMGDQWWAFGTPIHGSSPYCENEKAPIAAIITLEQGEENVLTRMDDFSALSYCLPEFYRPKMDEKTEETFWDSVDSLFRSVPVYHLVCRPDREATEIVKKEIFDV